VEVCPLASSFRGPIRGGDDETCKRSCRFWRPKLGYRTGRGPTIITSVPIANRNVFELAGLVPGVVATALMAVTCPRRTRRPPAEKPTSPSGRVGITPLLDRRSRSNPLLRPGARQRDGLPRTRFRGGVRLHLSTIRPTCRGQRILSLAAIWNQRHPRGVFYYIKTALERKRLHDQLAQ